MNPELSALLRKATGTTHPALLTSVIPALLRSISRAATALRTAHTVTQAGSSNVFGDDQLNVDVLAERAFRDEIAACPAIVAASSEEDPVERITSSSSSSDDDVYAIAFDPLDGSSIIAPNWSVGSITGIWSGRTALNRAPEALIASVLGVFGPRTTAIIAVRVPGREADAVCIEVAVDDDQSVVRADLALRDGMATRYFAPANLRAASEEPRYMALISHFITNRYTLRYCGGLVPDVVHALVKGNGVYVSPVTGRSKAKLRLAYELLPIAFVVECAGGRAIDPVDGSRYLERSVRSLEEKGGLVFGSVREVELVRGMLLGE